MPKKNMEFSVSLCGVRPRSAAYVEAVGGEGEGIGFVIGSDLQTRSASGGCGGSKRFAHAADFCY